MINNLNEIKKDGYLSELSVFIIEFMHYVGRIRRPRRIRHRHLLMSDATLARLIRPTNPPGEVRSYINFAVRMPVLCARSDAHQRQQAVDDQVNNPCRTEHLTS